MRDLVARGNLCKFVRSGVAEAARNAGVEFAYLDQ
jgi:hypothetical protein